MYENELYHHGVIGMKWGIRRYQNYDGSYTRKGVEHFKQAKAKYEEAHKVRKEVKDLYKQTKKKGYADFPNGDKAPVTKEMYKATKQIEKEAKNKMSRKYDQVKRDYHGDKGKALYNSGHTITGDSSKVAIAGTLATGAAYAAKYFHERGDTKMAQISMGVAAGAAAIGGIMGVKGRIDANNLRAYYTHSREKDD